MYKPCAYVNLSLIAPYDKHPLLTSVRAIACRSRIVETIKGGAFIRDALKVF